MAAQRKNSFQEGRWHDCLALLPALVNQGIASEDTHVGVIYHALQKSGIGTNRISLETYFKCASSSRMQQRPDLCLFSSAVGGRFNLYRNGDRGRSNDVLKIGKLEAIIEAKGSAATDRLSDASFARLIDADIRKLGKWRQQFTNSGYLRTGQHPDYVRIAIAKREQPLAAEKISALHALASREAVRLHYIDC